MSIRFTYVLNDWSFFDLTSIPSHCLDVDQVIKFGDLPIGAAEEPISEFRLMVRWIPSSNSSGFLNHAATLGRIMKLARRPAIDILIQYVAIP